MGFRDFDEPELIEPPNKRPPIDSLLLYLGESRRIAELVRDRNTDEHTRIKADAIARQLRELVKEAGELS